MQHLFLYIAKSNSAQPPAENSGSSTSSGGSGTYGNYHPIHLHYLISSCQSNVHFIFVLLSVARSSTGMASMMDEMAKTLARRRAQAEKKPDVSIFFSIHSFFENVAF